MTLSPTATSNTAPVDEDLAAQAHPGHGVPSQDPAAAAQFPLEPEEAEREAKSVFVGGGMVAGAAAGAGIGIVVAGPVGVVVGGTLGAVAGALGGAAAGSLANAEDPGSANTVYPGMRTRPHSNDWADSTLPTAQVNKLIAASARDIWAALTTPAALKQFFFGADVVTNWKVGSPIRMKGEFKGRPYEDKGDIVTFDPLRQLSFSHWSAMSRQADLPENYHLVTFDLVSEGAATRVTLSQANLTGGPTAADIAHRAEYEKNWTSVLDGLDKVLMYQESA